jgi:hypothetical protein
VTPLTSKQRNLKISGVLKMTLSGELHLLKPTSFQRQQLTQTQISLLSATTKNDYRTKQGIPGISHKVRISSHTKLMLLISHLGNATLYS